MAVTDEVTLRIVGRYQSQNIVNTMHYRIIDQASGNNEVLANLITAWIAQNESLWLGRHISTYSLIGYKAFNKTGDAKTPAFETAGDVGVVAGTELPASNCRTITLYTASAKHRRRGRVMLSGTAAAMVAVADGSVTATEMGLLDALGASLTAELQSLGDTFAPGIPATTVDSWENFTDSKGRNTPSLIKSRRIRQFLIG